VHSIGTAAAKIHSADLYHRRELYGGQFSIGVGYERRESATPEFDGDDMRGFVQWSKEFE
jgi:hypothetical protein